MKSILIAFIKFYQLIISPLIGSHCRFHPTCSAYTIEAIEVKGAMKGSFSGMKRILKCHPYHKGDFLDPVPETKPDCPVKSIATKGWFGYKRRQSQTSNKK